MVLSTSPADRAELLGRVHSLINSLATCVADNSLKHKNVYAFIMSTNQKGTVLANGNDANLNGLNFDLEDKELKGEDKKVVNLFRSSLDKNGDGNPVAGESAHVTYRWDDPQKNGDEYDGDYLKDKVVPGNSTKKGYIEVAWISKAFEDEYDNVELQNAPVIFGSGYYLSDPPATGMTKDDDDGCALAGTEHTSHSVLVNLLLISSVLLSVVFLRRRA